MGFLDPLSIGERALATVVLLAIVLAIATRGRGGRWRGLPGWAAWSSFFAISLVALERLPPWVSAPMLAGMMFFALRAYFFLAPMRSEDRFVIIASYVAIPLILWPTYLATPATFLATVPVLLFLVPPFVLALSPTREGLLDSMGRTILGVLVFLYCTAHLGLIARLIPGTVTLFGAMVIGVESVERLVGRFEPGHSKLRQWLTALLGAFIGGAIGFLLGPGCGLVEEDGGRVGILTGLAVSCGAFVWHKVAIDLEIRSSTSRIGRGGLLDRAIPAVYAAPVFYHYLAHFA